MSCRISPAQIGGGMAVNDRFVSWLGYCTDPFPSSRTRGWPGSSLAHTRSICYPWSPFPRRSMPLCMHSVYRVNRMLVSYISKLIGSLGEGYFLLLHPLSKAMRLPRVLHCWWRYVMLSYLLCLKPVEVKSQINLWDCFQAWGDAYAERATGVILIAVCLSCLL